MTSLGNTDISLWLERPFLRAVPNEKESFTEIQARKTGNVSKRVRILKRQQRVSAGLQCTFGAEYSMGLEIQQCPKISLVYNQNNICFGMYYNDS